MEPSSSEDAERAVTTIRPGPPGLLLAVLFPLGASGLVVFRAITSGLQATPDDPVPPTVIAVATIFGSLLAGWRSFTQRAELEPGHLRCRNLSASYLVAWDRIERLEVVRRPGLVFWRVHVAGLRRPHRLGPASRFPGPEADAVLDIVRSHPGAGPLIDDEPL